jgi:hypothetical protein
VVVSGGSLVTVGSLVTGSVEVSSPGAVEVSIVYEDESSGVVSSSPLPFLQDASAKITRSARISAANFLIFYISFILSVIGCSF